MLYLIIGLILICLIVWIIGDVFYNLALNPKAKKDKIFQSKHNKIDKANDNDKEILELENWKNTIIKEDLYIQSFDNLKLHAVRIKNNIEKDSNLYVLLCHGYTGNLKDMFKYGYHFYKKGYNLLIPDFRGHGDSEGTYVGMGWHDRLDIKRWIDEIIKENSNSKIVLFGISMGAAAVMMTSGENLPQNVKVVVEDCGYSSIWDEFKYQLKMIYKLPSFPVLHIASIVSKIKAGYWLWEGSAKEALRKSKLPTLFIHGKEDTYVPFEMLDKVYNSLNAPKEKIVVEGAAHSGASKILKEKYWEKVFLFIEKNI